MQKLFKITLLIVVLVIVGSGIVAFYTIFFGGRDVAVPGLEGMSVVEAAGLTERMGLLLRIDKVDSLQPAGVVVSQWPEAGTRVKKGKILILKVSRGGDRNPVPDVRGMEYSQAVMKLKDDGFEVGDIVRIHSEARPAGVVVAQSPAAPAMVPQSRRIDMLVSLGPPRKGGRIPVPDVMERSEQVARQIIGQSGLLVGSVRYEYTQVTPPGMVMNMEPRPGRTLPPGGAVTLVVATMKKPEAPEQEEIVETEVVPADQAASDVTAPGPIVLQPQDDGQPAPQDVVQQNQPAAPVANKTARIRYQVPPLAQSMPLRIEIIDASGSRVLLNQEVTSGQYVSLDAPYQDEAAVTIYLGGEFVWQDRYR